MTIEDVKATIQQGCQALDESRMTIEKVGVDLAETSAVALATLNDSNHEFAKMARTELAEAQHEVELMLRRIDAAKDHARSYLSALG